MEKQKYRIGTGETSTEERKWRNNKYRKGNGEPTNIGEEAEKQQT